ncbi:hypothetical protein FACS1894158_13930 [Betaproteobacteria bacterium]|nr:hypothetical protein FACS1894158_13930 [Betaproteobacteria bacterium]
MKDQYQHNRCTVIRQVLPDIDKMQVLELGAQARPTFYKNELNIKFLDYQSKGETCNKDFPGNPNNIWDKIVDVDYIVTSDEYHLFVNDKFDVVIANHVIEHVDDVVLFIKNTSNLLADNGVLFLSIPDKKMSFDKFRQNTPFSHIVTDYLLGGNWSALYHIIEIDMLYDLTFVNKPNNIEARLNSDLFKKQIGREPWIGLHRHVFEVESFRDQIINPILFSGYVDFNCIYCDTMLRGGMDEFYCFLKKGKTNKENIDLSKFQFA